MRILIVAPTHPDLPDVAREAAAVSNAHPGSRLLQGKVAERDLADAVASCCFDMLWLATHGAAEGLQLSDGLITGEALTAYVAASGAQLVFLNTCASIMLAQLLVDGESRTVKGEGGGPISAFMQALGGDPLIGSGLSLDVVDYSEHAVAVGGVSGGSDATAAAYVEARAADGTVRWGVGLHESILTASLLAVVSAVNRHLEATSTSGLSGPS